MGPLENPLTFLLLSHDTHRRPLLLHPRSPQVHDRASRLGLLEGPPLPLLLMSEASLDEVLAAVGRLMPALLVVDSIQTVALGGVDGRAGSITQVREPRARHAAELPPTGKFIEEP